MTGGHFGKAGLRFQSLSARHCQELETRTSRLDPYKTSCLVFTEIKSGQRHPTSGDCCSGGLAAFLPQLCSASGGCNRSASILA